MALAPGTRLGPYEVATQIGVGGMGEVYRARDTKLDRDVAIKVLPEALAADPDRIARFQREAKTLAALNHPNIAAIYGLEEADGVKALVMELVEGPTLADRIAQGVEVRRGGSSDPPLPVDEALAIAKQIAEALAAAHEQGIIHRDLKPANIKVRPDGTVKVLDFGLAKAMEPTSAMSASASMSPTITTPAMTQMGMILGTAAYMSPEQAKGRPADKRSDVWAFGAVVYEMVTGRRAFDGDDTTEVLGAVVRLEPDWAVVPSEVPPLVRALLQGCLVKDRRRRVADISTALFVLDKAAGLTAPDSASGESQIEAAVSASRQELATSMRRRTALVSVVALVAGAGLAAAVTWYGTRPAAPSVTRLTIAPSTDTAIAIDGAERNLAITPDGARLVYRGQNTLFVRALDQLTPTALTGLGAPRGAFISPDGQSVGFFDGNAVLKKVAIGGGPPVTVTAVDGAARGATWGEDGTIIYATNSRTTGLQRVSAAGGDPTVLTTPDREGGVRHYWPEFLPGGQAVLFTIFPAGGDLDNAQIAVLDLRTNTQTVLLRGGHHARYVPTGHLVYGAGGTLRAVAFDLARLSVTGTPVPVVEQVLTQTSGVVDAAVAGDGTLAYVSGRATDLRTLVWVSRQGQETPIAMPPHPYAFAQLSPDGTRVAVEIRDDESDIWIWDLVRETLQRLTFDPGLNRVPLWAPDGRRVAFSRVLESSEEVYWQAADGSGVAEPLTASSGVGVVSYDFTPDGRALLYGSATVPNDIRSVPVGSPPTAGIALLRGPASQLGGSVSPDGRWLAYQSDESGRAEVYVRPFPDVDRGRWQISAGGGTRPRWSRDGKELFYYIPRANGGALMAVPVQPGATFASGRSRELFEGPYVAPSPNRHTYDVSPDGQRFLMIKNVDEVARPQIIVVQHWTEELKRLVPVE